MRLLQTRSQRVSKRQIQDSAQVISIPVPALNHYANVPAPVTIKVVHLPNHLATENSCPPDSCLGLISWPLFCPILTQTPGWQKCHACRRCTHLLRGSAVWRPYVQVLGKCISPVTLAKFLNAHDSVSTSVK